VTAWLATAGQSGAGSLAVGLQLHNNEHVPGQLPAARQSGAGILAASTQ